MKKQIASLCCLMALLLATSACGAKKNATTESRPPVNTAVVATAAQNNTNTAVKKKENQAATPIILTINGKKLNAYLNDSAPAQSLKGQLPKTVRLNDSDNDFCGDSINIAYSEKDVQNGYKNGDLAFWPPARNFVIFVKDEEKSAATGNLVILGHITESQSVLDSLHGTLEVKIELAK